jgi:pimeloyl-ACP methyl ester carboxylesterase
MDFVTIDGRRLEILRIAGAAPALLLLHEGLGSVAMWRDFPARLAARTGRETIAYSRLGYGRSDRRAAPYAPDYMHREATGTLPALIAALGLEAPVLVGHSDGASIALIHAGSPGAVVSGVVAMAPHVFVEAVSIESIAAARQAFRDADLRERLARYHGDVDGAFGGWNDAWLDPAFRAWNIEEYLPRIACPVLVIQGRDDEYGTLAQVEAIRRGVRNGTALVLDDCRHSPQRDQPEPTLAAIADFLGRTCRKI